MLGEGIIGILGTPFTYSHLRKELFQLALPCPGDKTARQFKCGPFNSTQETLVHINQ